MPMAESSQRAETVGGAALVRAVCESGLGLLLGIGGFLNQLQKETYFILVAQGLVREISIPSKPEWAANCSPAFA